MANTKEEMLTSVAEKVQNHAIERRDVVEIRSVLEELVTWVDDNAGTPVHGTVTLSSGSASVSDANILADSLIFITRGTTGGTAGILGVSNVSNGSFSIISSSEDESSIVSWMIL